MLSKWSWILLNLIIYVNTNVLTSQTQAFLELTELDYEDECYNNTNIQWSFTASPSNTTLFTWEEQQNHYAVFKKNQRAEVLNMMTEYAIERLDSLLQYKFDMIVKPGDTLLPEEDWKRLIHFVGVAELQRSTIIYINKSQNYSREDVEYLLSHSGKVEDKQAAWNGWYCELKPLLANYSNNLQLIAEAAKENGAKSVEEYWEMLAGYPGAYDKIESDWSRINTLHKKLLNFIRTNLSKKYGITLNDTLPVYLLGTLQGHDWTNLPSDVLPYSNVIYDVRKKLWKKKYAGKSVYKIASNLGSTLLRKVPESPFWEDSEFDKQCPSRLLNFCRDSIMRMSTCSRATLSSFLKAHKDIGEILFNQITIESTPVLNTVNRYSVLEESVSILFEILSASPAWLNHTQLMSTSNDEDQHKIVSLTITALSILPQLAYYYAADMWRLNAIKENITDPVDLVSSWWQYRQKYEGVSCIDMDIPTFLDDSYIISNKPYLSKILGTLLAFQLYEDSVDSTALRYDNIDNKLIKSNIIKMIQKSGALKWLDILDKFLSIDDVDPDALLSYFTWLEEFIEENEEDFEYKSGLKEDEELEALEKRILQEMRTPTTTSAPITTTVRTVKPIVKHIPSEKDKASQIQSKETQPKSFVYPREDKPKNPDSSGSTQVPVDKSLTSGTLNNTQDNTPKTTRIKAVWAVSAVIVGVIIICIIAIFGGRRCRRTPKNRRIIKNTAVEN